MKAPVHSDLEFTKACQRCPTVYLRRGFGGPAAGGSDPEFGARESVGIGGPLEWFVNVGLEIAWRASRHRMTPRKVQRADISQNYFLPSTRMREVKARPSKALKVRNWGDSMSLLTTNGLLWSVMLSTPPRSSQKYPKR
jgi:hypothetical protein